MASNLIHRFGATGGGTPVNAYIVEGTSGCVVVDSTLTVSDGRALRARVDELGKPLLGAFTTHAHPDHYGALVALMEGLEAPIFATAGVAHVIERDDPVKEEILRPMFGDEWAAERLFPRNIVADGETVSLGVISLRVTDLGPGESPHDSIWSLEDEGRRQVFSGDLFYDRMHCYLADGFHREWLANIDRARREFPSGVTLYPGHGLLHGRRRQRRLVGSRRCAGNCRREDARVPPDGRAPLPDGALDRSGRRPAGRPLMRISRLGGGTCAP